MKRIDYCKNQLKDSVGVKTKKKKREKEDIDLIFQELNNFLPTYHEKKELQNYYNELKKK